MTRINYETMVNIARQTMDLQVNGILPEAMWGKHIRLQAVFTQRLTQRRFPMETVIEQDELDQLFRASARIRLPFVFRVPPRSQVTVTFAFWCGTEEICLDEKPFPVNKEQFMPGDSGRTRNPLVYGLCTLLLPAILLKNYLACGRNLSEAKKRANAQVYRASGYSYSPRQRNTDYFAGRYRKEVRKNPELSGNKVLFLSERLPEEGGNLMRIREHFLKDPDIEVMDFIHTETVDRLSKKDLRECAGKCAAAKIIILEDFYPQLHSIHKRSETVIVQLWHACGAFKTFGLSRTGKKGGAPQSSQNHRNYDLVTVSSRKMINIYAEAFALNPACVKALGVPRTDDLFDEEYKKKKKEELYEKYPLLKGRKVVLFAPTFRGDGNKDAFYPDHVFDADAFLARMPEDAVLIVRQHPFVGGRPVRAKEYKDRFLDLTDKDHINDLMIVCDLLITDYSSSVFEAALLRLPMLFYAFDEEDYIRDRDFYFGYRDFVPGKIVKDPETLAGEAAKILAGDRPPVDEDFIEDYLGALDGRSCDRISNYIKKLL